MGFEVDRVALKYGFPLVLPMQEGIQFHTWCGKKQGDWQRCARTDNAAASAFIRHLG